MGTRPTPLVEESTVRRGRSEAEVSPRLGCCQASAVGAHEEAFAHKVGFGDGFDGLCFLSDRHGQGRQAHWSTRKTTTDGIENRAVQAIQTGRVDLEELERAARGLKGQLSVAMHLGVVDDATQEAVRDSGSAARTRSDLMGGLRVDG